jgi:O-antigen ligase
MLRLALMFLLTVVVIIVPIFIWLNSGNQSLATERYSGAKIKEDLATKDDRHILWEAAELDFINSPFTGIGFGGYDSGGLLSGMDVGEIYASRDYPHNVFLETAAECGIPGIILLGLAVAKPLIQFFSKKCWLKEESFCFGIWVFGFINAQISGDLISNQILWFGAGLLAAAYSAPKVASSQ